MIGVVLATGCGQPSPLPAAAAKPAAAAPKIPMFYTTPSVLRDGEPSQLCYSTGNATTVTLDPPVERVWPALSRCFEIKPAKNTTYTLTAANAAGATVTATATATIGPPRVKIIEVSVDSLQINKGEAFPFCVKARNAASWKLSGGQWRQPPGPAGGCVVDHPSKTTTYVITAVGAMGETDSERVTATVK